MWGNSHEYSNKIVEGKSAAKPDYSGTFTEHNGNLDYGSGRCARSRSVRPLIISVICSRWRGDGISAVAKDNIAAYAGKTNIKALYEQRTKIELLLYTIIIVR